MRTSTVSVNSTPKKFRILGGLLIGATVAGIAASLALKNLLRQEFQPQHVDTQDNDQVDPREAEANSDGIVSLNNEYFEVAGLTDPGKRRANNQDSFRLGSTKFAGQDQFLAIVCDGMGGHAGGEVASQIAADLIWTVLSKQANESNDEALYNSMRGALERADAAIEQRASKERELDGMGTTAVLAAIRRDNYLHCYVGDSRLYHFKSRSVSYQTKDHSLVRYLVEEGVIAKDEAREHPYRSQLTSSLGGGQNSNRLTIEPKWDGKDSPLREWASGDWLVLCSDGLNSELDDTDIAAVLSDCEDVKQAAVALKEKVLETEARDNVTVIVARKL